MSDFAPRDNFDANAIPRFVAVMCGLVAPCMERVSDAARLLTDPISNPDAFSSAPQPQVSGKRAPAALDVASEAAGVLRADGRAA